MTTITTTPAFRNLQNVTLVSAMKLRLKGIQVRKSYTISAMLRTASHLTGKHYPHSKKSLQLAIDDLITMRNPQ
jgi:hypothetical protein